jgi:hypothetical protein
LIVAPSVFSNSLQTGHMKSSYRSMTTGPVPTANAVPPSTATLGVVSCAALFLSCDDMMP